MLFPINVPSVMRTTAPDPFFGFGAHDSIPHNSILYRVKRAHFKIIAIAVRMVHDFQR